VIVRIGTENNVREEKKRMFLTGDVARRIINLSSAG